jgi:hypothetical protein
VVVAEIPTEAVILNISFDGVVNQEIVETLEFPVAHGRVSVAGNIGGIEHAETRTIVRISMVEVEPIDREFSLLVDGPDIHLIANSHMKISLQENDEFAVPRNDKLAGNDIPVVDDVRAGDMDAAPGNDGPLVDDVPVVDGVPVVDDVPVVDGGPVVDDVGAGDMDGAPGNNGPVVDDGPVVDMDAAPRNDGPVVDNVPDDRKTRFRRWRASAAIRSPRTWSQSAYPSVNLACVTLRALRLTLTERPSFTPSVYQVNFTPRNPVWMTVADDDVALRQGSATDKPNLGYAKRSDMFLWSQKFDEIPEWKAIGLAQRRADFPMVPDSARAKQILTFTTRPRAIDDSAWILERVLTWPDDLTDEKQEEKRRERLMCFIQCLAYLREIFAVDLEPGNIEQCAVGLYPSLRA